ncbi:MAG: hypothetical protein RL769_427, partial [Pseudomonadota bacterium]
LKKRQKKIESISDIKDPQDSTDPNFISFLSSLSSDDKKKVIEQYSINPAIIKDTMEQQNFSNNIKKVLQELKIDKVNNISNQDKPVMPYLDPDEKARKTEYVRKVLEGLKSNNSSQESSGSSSTSSSGFSSGDFRGNANNQKENLSNPNLQKISKPRAQQIYNNIFDNQISGSKDARLEIEKKLLQTLEEKFGLDPNSLIANEPNEKFNQILKDAFKAGGDRDPKLAEVKMLVSAIGQVNDKITQLEIKKQDERLRQEMIKILEESEEMIAYRLHEERRMKNMVIVVPVQKAQTINELFGNAGIISSSQIEDKNPDNSQQPNNNSPQNPQQQVEVVEKVVVIEVHSPQEHFALQNSSGVKQNSGVAQSQLGTGANVRQSDKIAEAGSNKQVVGKFTEAVLISRNSTRAMG